MRTQAERDADGTTWRATAHTRPGYATYPNTPAGDPSWWRRSSPSIAPECSTSHPQLHADCDGCGCSCHRPPAVVAGPPPADGETCVKWCGFCHLGPEPQPERTSDGPGLLPPIPDSAYPPDAVDLPAEPRRRWWHRYTRRNP